MASRGPWRGKLPTTRTYDQSAMTTFLTDLPKKKKQRVKDNASDLRPAPAGHVCPHGNEAGCAACAARQKSLVSAAAPLAGVPKEPKDVVDDPWKTDDDEPKPKPAPTATTPNKADGDVEILTVRSPHGTIEIIDSPEPKLLLSAQATSNVVFDMSGVKHGDVVEPKVDKVLVEDPRSFTVRLDCLGLDLSQFKGNRIYDELPVVNPTSAADVRPTLQRLRGKYLGRYPFMKGVGGKLGASGAELVYFKRNKSDKYYGMYPREFWEVDETVLLSCGIGSNRVLKEVENLGNESRWFTNAVLSAGLDGLHKPGGGRIQLSEDEEGDKGSVYLMFLKPNKDFQSAADVKKAHFDLLAKHLAINSVAVYSPDPPYRKIHTPRVNYPDLVKLLELSPIPEKQIHVAFTRQGVAYINQLCANYPDVMKARGNKEFILKEHYPKLCDAYKARFPGRAATVRSIRGGSKEAKSQMGPGRSPF